MPDESGDFKYLVLYVEDDPEYQKTVMDALHSIGARTIIAEDVAAGIKCAMQHDAESEEPLALIIVDLALPESRGALVSHDENQELLGIQLVRRYNVLKKRVPIVAFTAYDHYSDHGYDDCVKVVKAGADAYVPKQHPSFSGIEKLRETCRRLLTPPVVMPSDEPHLPDTWLAANYRHLAKKYPGKDLIFVPALVAKECGLVEQVRDEFMIVSKDTVGELVTLMAEHPEIARLKLPIILIPSFEDTGAESEDER